MTSKSKLRPAGTFDVDWQQLIQAGQAPEMGGRSAEEARRNERRKRPITPSERRRRKRRLSLTVSEELIAELRKICRDFGYVNADDEGILASPVLENLLWLVVGAYRDGLVERYQERVEAAVDRLRWKA